MQQLETIKGKTIIIPNIVKRYSVLYYDYNGWTISNSNLYTTPEDALQSFFNWQETISDEKYRAKFYKIFEVELEIPFIPKS
jgi:hypothetical protein